VFRNLTLFATLALGAATGLIAVQNPAPDDIVILQRDYDMRALLSAPPLSEQALRGRALWLQRCAYCHDGVGTPTYKTLGPWLDVETLRPEREASVRQFIATGSTRMPGFRYTLQPEQVDQLIAFLKSVTPDQKPTAEQLSKSPSTEAPTQ